MLTARCGCGRRQEHVPRTHALGGTTQGCGEAAFRALALRAPGRKQRMNGLGRRVGAVPGALAQVRWSTGGPFGRGPSPLKPLWLLAAPYLFLFPAFPLMRQETSGSQPLQPRQVWATEDLFLGGVLRRQSWRSGIVLGIRKPGFKRTGLLPFLHILVILAKPTCSLGLDVLHVQWSKEAWFDIYGRRAQRDHAGS